MVRAISLLIIAVTLLLSWCIPVNADDGLMKLLTATSTIVVKNPTADTLKEIRALLPKTVDVTRIGDTRFYVLAVEAPTAKFAANFVNKHALKVIRNFKESGRQVKICEMAAPESAAIREEYDKLMNGK